jgi:hypothetical protein
LRDGKELARRCQSVFGFHSPLAKWLSRWTFGVGRWRFGSSSAEFGTRNTAIPQDRVVMAELCKALGNRDRFTKDEDQDESERAGAD